MRDIAVSSQHVRFDSAICHLHPPTPQKYTNSTLPKAVSAPLALAGAVLRLIELKSDCGGSHWEAFRGLFAYERVGMEGWVGREISEAPTTKAAAKVNTGPDEEKRF